MNDRQLSDKIHLTELVNKLFMYVDDQRWEQVLNEVFTKEVWFDMTSVSGEAKNYRQKTFAKCGDKVLLALTVYTTKQDIISLW